MIRRAVPALIVVIVGFVGLFAIGRDAPTEVPATFALQAGSWMPHVNDTDKLTSSWFCPGLPASGEDGVGGEVVVSNRAGEQLVGRFNVLTPDGVAATQDFTVEPWSQDTIDISSLATAPFVSVIVELDGGGGLVEQRALHPAGNSVAPCSNDTSDTWYLADGFTADGSVESLILTNPYDDVAIAQLTFATESAESSPSAFRGFPIPPRSVKVIPLADPALGVQDEPVIAVEVTTTTGRIVLGRAQHYLGGGRLGYEVTLAAPAPRDQFWFADGEQGDGITETYAIYNPTDADVDVDAVFLGLPVEANFGGIPTITVPSRRVVVFDPTDEQYAGTVPDGRHAVVFSTLAEPSIVVERALTRPGRRFGGDVGPARGAAARRRLRRHPVASRDRARRTDDRRAHRLQRRQRRRNRHGPSGRPGWSDGDRRAERHPHRAGRRDDDRPHGTRCTEPRAHRHGIQPGLRGTIAGAGRRPAGSLEFVGLAVVGRLVTIR